MYIKLLLKSNSIFKNLTDEELDNIIPYITTVNITKDQMIFSDGDEGDALYIITNGMIRIYKKIDATKEKTLSQLKNGDCFGEMALIDDNVRSASAKSMTNGSLLILTREGFHKLVTEQPAAGFKILMELAKILTKRLREADEQILDILSFHFQKK
ncbi:MAG TPA: cyclic nucleotide-binding domain-containing protein [bacterium]|nr:cyclic nucleotide-binding domain-containing protein [bacterium]HPN32343.1 cyclic nucleotide-binding domain-containing protein [bacterium]